MIESSHLHDLGAANSAGNMQCRFAFAVDGVDGNGRLCLPFIRKLLDAHTLLAIAKWMAELGLVLLRYVGLATGPFQTQVIRGQSDVALGDGGEQPVDLMHSVHDDTPIAVGASMINETNDSALSEKRATKRESIPEFAGRADGIAGPGCTVAAFGIHLPLRGAVS